MNENIIPFPTVQSEREQSPEHIAQFLVYDAWELADPRKRVKLANKALEIWPDCADAYSILANDRALSFREKFMWTEFAVEAGERALGPEFFRENKGHFWGALESRPYMRARFALAQLLWVKGEEAEAIGHAKELLALNPNDNQGIRYILVNWFLAKGDTDGADKLFKKYGSAIGAHWAYSKLLHVLGSEGPGKKAEMRLKKALAENPHVLKYLRKPKLLPKELPDSYIVRSDDEAAIYVAEALQAWEATSGALAWIKTHTAT